MFVESDNAHEEEDENYFVSMTDMMVGILFIFIIMLMVFALNFRQKTDEQENKLEIAEELTQQIEKLQSRIGQEFVLLKEADATRLRLLETLEKRLQQEKLSVQIDAANGVLRLTDNTVSFAPDKSDLDAQAKANVQKIATALADTLPAYTHCTGSPQCVGNAVPNRVETVFIEGHTDKTGLDDRNWQLSTERAVNTYRTIIDTKPALDDLRNGANRAVLSVSGYSSRRPVSTGQAKDDYAVNRRIDLRFVMEANPAERLLELKRLLGEMEQKIQLLRAPRGANREVGWRPVGE